MSMPHIDGVPIDQLGDVVELCPSCTRAREALDECGRVLYKLGATIGGVSGQAKLEVPDCTRCQRRGWVLTTAGRGLVALIRQELRGAGE